MVAKVANFFKLIRCLHSPPMVAKVANPNDLFDDLIPISIDYKDISYWNQINVTEYDMQVI